MTLLFDDKHQYLGELLLQDGTLRHLVLTQAGENLVGAQVARWQTRGIGVSRLIPAAKPDGSKEDVVFQQFIQPRQKEFGEAFKLWAAEHGFHAIDIEEKMLALWEMLLRLPFEAGERYAVLVAIRSAPNQFHEWKACLQEAEQATRLPGESVDKTRELMKIKAKAGKSFAH